jgi:hypothetical protein
VLNFIVNRPGRPVTIMKSDICSVASYFTACDPYNETTENEKSSASQRRFWTTALLSRNPFSPVNGPCASHQLPFLTNQDTHQQDRSGTSDNSRARAQDRGSGKKPAYETFATTPPSPTQSGALLVSALLEQGSYFLQQHVEMQRKTYQKLHALIMYKPPVGT